MPRSAAHAYWQVIAERCLLALYMHCSTTSLADELVALNGVGSNMRGRVTCVPAPFPPPRDTMVRHHDIAPRALMQEPLLAAVNRDAKRFLSLSDAKIFFHRTRRDSPHSEKGKSAASP
ncbi:hypothetical protein BKA70DRAFT_1220232 [Coprinopsis sp. MPI-PUGE-AT-0042]|nr:hypothetical protein BKA70DRAFT_1220232 [Coprinopsis sp. MPI-PUGE-AT-0042]